MPLPQDITSDALTMVKMHTASRRRQLEITLAKFNVSISVITLYQYLSAKAYLKRSVENELEVLKEIYTVVPLTDEILLKGAMIEASLLREGIMMDVEDILVAATSITQGTLLVTDDPRRYEPLRKFGLDTMPLESFLRELERIAKRELD